MVCFVFEINEIGLCGPGWLELVSLPARASPVLDYGNMSISFRLGAQSGSELVILSLPSAGKQVYVTVRGSWIVTFVRG